MEHKLNQIVFADKVFDTAPYPIETEPPILSKKILRDGMNRDFLRITVYGSYNDVLAYFVNDATYSIRNYEYIPAEEAVVSEEDGSIIKEAIPEQEFVKDYDWSSYCIAGDIIDHRNGTITVYMSKPTQYELNLSELEQENASLLFATITGEELEL